MKNFWDFLSFISGLSAGWGATFVIRNFAATYNRFWADILAFFLFWTVLIRGIYLFRKYVYVE